MKHLQKILSSPSDSHKKLSTLESFSDNNRNSLNKHSINVVLPFNNNTNNKHFRNVFKFPTQALTTSPYKNLNFD
jgi:hypothetical protein